MSSNKGKHTKKPGKSPKLRQAIKREAEKNEIKQKKSLTIWRENVINK